MEANPPRDSLALLLAELDGPDGPEHPDVVVFHETGWTLSAFGSGLLVFENAEDNAAAPRHMTNVPRTTMQTLFTRLAAGDVAAVAGHDWQDGYGGG